MTVLTEQRIFNTRHQGMWVKKANSRLVAAFGPTKSAYSVALK
jgi:hypothetical protein